MKMGWSPSVSFTVCVCVGGGCYKCLDAWGGQTTVLDSLKPSYRWLWASSCECWELNLSFSRRSASILDD